LSSRRLAPALAVALLLTATVRADDGGGLVGWVESTRGVPVAGAVISVFGEGIRGGSLITLADSDGQFMLPSLPAGSYTLRAIGTGHLPSAAERVTVLPNRDSLFTLSLTPVSDQGEGAGAQADSKDAGSADEDDSLREWRWLLRHKRRSVLETASHETAKPTATAAVSVTPPTTSDDVLGALDGSVEVVALSGTSGTADTLDDSSGLPSGLGTLKLHGRLADGVHWSLGGLLTEREGRSWRMAAEFVVEPGSGHEIHTGAGYGAGYTHAPFPTEAATTADRPVGAFFVRDRWRVGERLTTEFGARYTYIGFLSNPHHADAVVQIELRGDEPGTVVHGSVSTRTLAPGGDLLTLSTSSASPAISWARLDDDIRASRTINYEVGVDRTLGGGSVSAFAFGEQTRDQLFTAFDETGALRVSNIGQVGAHGIGVRVGRRIGRAFNGTVTYTFGRATHPSWTGAAADPLAFEDAQFHDVVARVETFINWTDTRVAALYRLNTLSDEGGAPVARPGGSSTTTRFDLQVTQGLPFMQPLTRADWELLVAVSNIFYEASEGGFLDELTVQEPPTRVVGGVSVRF